MRPFHSGLAALLLAGIAMPAVAEDAAAPTPTVTVTGGVTAVSDYRFRGISQSDKRFAIQGTINVNHESGFYVGTWGSSIDDYVAAGGDQEIDLYGGYKKTFAGTTADIGVLYYYYPGSHGANTDFIEPYASLTHTFGPATAKVGAAYAPKAHALAAATTGHSRDDNLYVYGELGGAIPGTGFSISSHLGYNHGRSFLTNGLKGYLDWNVGGAYAWKNLSFGVAYVDTDFDKGEFITPSGRNAVKGGIVFSIGATF